MTIITSERGNIALTIALILFVGVIILGVAYGLSHDSGLDVTATVNGVSSAINQACSVAQELCTNR